MRRLLILTIAACFCLTVPAMAGNVAPKLYLEVWNYAEVPDPIPTDVCKHLTKPTGGIHCYDVKVAYNYAVVGFHVGNLDTPICSTTGVDCAAFGGFVGCPFGVASSGEAVNFASWTACPGFLKGVSVAGEPSACSSNSTSGCHNWWDHSGYLSYLNLSTRTGATFFDIVANADLGHNRVINCAFTYDNGTTIGYRAQWGGTSTLTCPSTAVEETTWSKVKSLFR